MSKENGTGAWSVFQAMDDLTRIAKEQLGFTPEINNRNIYINEKKTKYFPPEGNKSDRDIHLMEKDLYGWDTIAHEFSHAVLVESGAIVPQSGNHNDNFNLYDYNESGVYGNKEKAMALAFGEGAATWLGVSLLKHSNYKYKKKEDGKYEGIEIVGDGLSAQIHYVGGHSQVMRSDRDLDLNEETGKINCYGEDAELAIVKLLWNITNRAGGTFERIVPEGKITNKVNISLKTLFNEVLKGKGLKNTSELYKNLLDHHAYNNNSLPTGDLSTIKLEVLEKISELGNLFAEFGIAPNIDQAAQEGNKLIWYQHKTGTLPVHDKFELYFFDRHSGELLYKTDDLTIKATKIEATKTSEEKYRYEYSLDNTASPELENYDESSIRVLIKASACEQFETGPYFNHVSTSFEPYDNFIPDPSGRTCFLEPGIALRLGSINGQNIRVSSIIMGDIDYEFVTDPWKKGLSVIAINTSSRPIFIMHGTREIPGIETHEDGSEENVMIEAPSCKELEWEWE